MTIRLAPEIPGHCRRKFTMNRRAITPAWPSRTTAHWRWLSRTAVRGSSFSIRTQRCLVIFSGLLFQQIKESAGDSSVAALVPMVRSGDIVVSPKRVGFFGLKALPESCHGIQDVEVTSINSGSAIRCDFVRSVGGFNRSFWLDYLDHWLFRQIYATGRKVAIWKCTIEHSLSVQDYRRNIQIERYRSILAGESTFITTYKPKVQIPVYLLRLLVRSVRLMSQGQFSLARLTFATIVKIAFHPTRSLEDSCYEPDVYQS